MATYDIGDLVRVTGTFTTAAGAAVDPAGTVTCQILTPAGVESTLVYGVDAELVKSSTGIYYADISVTAAGVWKYRFSGTGNGQAAGESWLEATPTEFTT